MNAVPDDLKKTFPVDKTPLNLLSAARLTERLRVLKNQPRWLMGAIIGLVFICLVCVTWLLVRHHRVSTTNNRQISQVLNQLTNVEQQLQSLSQSPQNADSLQLQKNAFAVITSDLSVLQRSLKATATEHTVGNVSHQINNLQSDLDQQLMDLKKAVSVGASAAIVLDPKALPFQVVSVDVIGGQPIVSINYDHQIMPLSIGDSIAGWTVAVARYAKQQVDFKNANEQHVRVSLAEDVA